MSLRGAQHRYSCSNDIRENVILRSGSDSRLGTIYRFYRTTMFRKLYCTGLARIVATRTFSDELIKYIGELT